MISVRYITILLVLIFGHTLLSQNLEELCKTDPFKISGGVSTNHSYFGSSEGIGGREPYTYTVSGNLSTSIIGISMPLSFSYSNNNVTYQQPYNQLSFSPTFKWVTAHVGYSSMSFSPYSLSGEQFAGVGIEMSPTSSFSMKAMYGSLRKAIDYIPDEEFNFPAFQRMGYGVQTDFEIKGVSMGFSIFKAKDVENSIYIKTPETKADSLKVLVPKENLVLTTNTSFSLLRVLNITVEYATTAYTDDIRSTTPEEGEDNIFKYTGKLMENRVSTSFYDAVKGGANLNLSFMTVGVNYERVQPGYKTLGSEFTNNDFENATVNFTSSLFKNKITLAANVGNQTNNLNDKKSRKSSKLVKSLNIGLSMIKNLSANISYSNFTSLTKIKSFVDDELNSNNIVYVDTLRSTQISENANVALAYRLSKSKTMNQNVVLNVSFQRGESLQYTSNAENPVTLVTTVVALYSMKYKPWDVSLNSTFNYNKNEVAGMNSSALGPNLSVSKAFFKKKLRSSLNAAYNQSYSEDELKGENLSFRLNFSYVLKKKHNFSLSSSITSKKSYSAKANVGREDYSVNFSYSYSF